MFATILQTIDFFQAAQFQLLLPAAIGLIAKLVTENQERAVEAMEIFDELFECEVALVVPHIKPIVDLCLHVAETKSLENSLRARAITFIGRLVRLKKKTVVKNKLYVRMIMVLFSVMAEPSEEDMADEEADNSSENLAGGSPSMCACQTLDVLAVNLPPEKFMVPKAVFLMALIIIITIIHYL